MHGTKIEILGIQYVKADVLVFFLHPRRSCFLYGSMFAVTYNALIFMHLDIGYTGTQGQNVSHIHAYYMPLTGTRARIYFQHMESTSNLDVLIKPFLLHQS